MGTIATIKPAFERTLGVRDAAALVVSNSIGVGIFTTPGIVAGMVPDPSAIMLLWVVGGALSLAGARAYAELAKRRPYAGGEYLYLRDGFGPLLGFLSGWTSFIAGFSGAIAAGAIGVAVYLGRFFPAAADTNPWFSVPVLQLSNRSLVAIAVIAILSAIHICGIRLGRVVQTLLAATCVAAILFLLISGFLRGHATAGRVASSQGDGWSKLLVALIPIMFTYSGWNAAVYVAEEMRAPETSIWKAIATGTCIVAALYVALNFLYLRILGVSALAGVVNSGDAVANNLFGDVGARAFSALIVIVLAGGISAMIIAGPRVYFSMERDGLFVPGMQQLVGASRTPVRSIIAQAVWCTALILTGTFQQLLIYTGFAVVLFSALTVVGLFRAVPSHLLPFRVKAVALIFAAVMLSIAVNGTISQPRPTLAGLGLILAGIPLYWWRTRPTRSS